MMRATGAAGLVLVFAVAVTAEQPKKFESKDGRFAVAFPDAPTTKTSKTSKTSKTTKGSKDGATTGRASALNPVASTSRIDIGIASGDRKEIAEGLSRYLADAFTLYLKTHNFHWNVTGPMFNSLHVMFETQYTEQWNALDEVAERTRALGFNTPGSYAEFIRLTSIREEPGAARWVEAGDEEDAGAAGHGAQATTPRR